MKLTVKKLYWTTMNVGHKGVEFEVRNASGTHLGDLIVKKSGLEWCRGKAQRGKGGKEISWKKLDKWARERS